MLTVFFSDVPRFILLSFPFCLGTSFSHSFRVALVVTNSFSFSLSSECLDFAFILKRYFHLKDMILG